MEEKTVVVAVKESLHALRWTIENILRQSESSSWPWKSAGKINLVVVRSAHVTPRLLSCCFSASPPSNSSPFTASDVRKELEKSCTKQVIEAVQTDCDKREVEVKIIESSGDPRLKVFQLVKEMKADVLVLGGHDYGGIRRFVLGSVADSFVGYAKARALECHLVIVHQKRGTPSFVSIHHAEKRS